ncbi:hypothetical protein [Metarhizobium album]|uniref:hypothetical protein n=1 Tax=Metarhizobium album TaxID=2182425 RepID=UPI000FFE5493|nr:hypothetical protein [Rhizobium album]
MTEKRNPAGHGLRQVLNIKALAGVDAQNPNETILENQSETLAARHLVRRFGIGFHHARVICELSGLGGAA